MTIETVINTTALARAAMTTRWGFVPLHLAFDWDPGRDYQSCTPYSVPEADLGAMYFDALEDITPDHVLYERRINR